MEMQRKKPAPKCAWKPKPSWLRRKLPGSTALGRALTKLAEQLGSA